MRVIAFITDPPTIHDILVHLGEPTAPPQIAPARGPPLCDLPDAGPGSFDPPPAFSAKTADRGSKKVSPMVMRTSACQPSG
jgi:hypothetical protein